VPEVARARLTVLAKLERVVRSVGGFDGGVVTHVEAVAVKRPNACESPEVTGRGRPDQRLGTGIARHHVRHRGRLRRAVAAHAGGVGIVDRPVQPFIDPDERPPSSRRLAAAARPLGSMPARPWLAGR